MSPRNLLFLAALLVILALMYLVAQRSASPPGPREVLFVTLGSPEWQKVDRLRVFWGKSPEKALIFIRKEREKWEVYGPSPEDFPHPAKKPLLKSLLADLSRLSGEERASGKAFWARFSVTEEEALHLVGLKGEKEVFHLLVGKRGPAWGSCFVRISGKEAIYLVPENLLARFEIWKETPEPPTLKPWVDLQILGGPIAEIKSLTLFWKDKRLWRVEKDQKKKWWLLKGKKREAFTEAENKLREILPLFAEEVLPPDSSGDPIGKLIMETTLGRSLELAILKDSRGEYLVKRPPYIYRLSKENLKRLQEIF